MAAEKRAVVVEDGPAVLMTGSLASEVMAIETGPVAWVKMADETGFDRLYG